MYVGLFSGVNSARFMPKVPFPIFVNSYKGAIMACKTKTRTVNRDSVSGQFVPERYAKAHPKTTETEKVRVLVNPKPKKP